jgi:hypothetical protein
VSILDGFPYFDKFLSMFTIMRLCSLHVEGYTWCYCYEIVLDYI